MIERWLYHSPLPLPEVPLAHHEAVTKEEGNAFDDLTFYVVLPVLNEHVVRKLDVPDRIHAGPIHGGLVDVTEDSELTTHPVQEVVSDSIFLLRARRYASVFDFHICALLPHVSVQRINRDSHFEFRGLYTRPSERQRTGRRLWPSENGSSPSSSSSPIRLRSRVTSVSAGSCRGACEGGVRSG